MYFTHRLYYIQCLVIKFIHTLQYTNYVIYWHYDIQPSALLIYGVVLLETTLLPLSIDTSQSLFATFQRACTPYVSRPRNHEIYQLTLIPHMAVSWIDIQ
jgi:hypothetical protein